MADAVATVPVSHLHHSEILVDGDGTVMEVTTQDKMDTT